MLYKKSSKIEDKNNVNVDKAIEYMKKLDLDKAKEYTTLAMVEDNDSGTPQNLLGIYYELIGNLDLARKHYRAALALEPSLECANNNLQRLCEFKYICSCEYIDFGQVAN